MRPDLSSICKCVAFWVILHYVNADGDRSIGRVRYENFDDYLVGALGSVTSQSSTSPSRSRPGRFPPLSAQRRGDNTQQGNTTDNTAQPTTPDLLEYFRDVPLQHWSCCMLGKLSGNKGFHCHAQMYRSRITARNYNRSFNRRLPVYGLHRIRNYGRALMNTFKRCVNRSNAHEFHKCCFAATVETREMNRWQHMYRQQSLENEATDV